MGGCRSSVLIVDDEVHVCSLICKCLSRCGFRCVVATDAIQARQALQRQPFEVMIADVSMPLTSGLDLLSYARHTGRVGKVILISGVLSTDMLAEALRLGAYNYLQKPFELSRLIDVVTQAAGGSRHSDDLPAKAARAMQMEPTLRRASLESIQALVHAVEAKDPYTRRHSEQVALYATQIAAHLCLDEDTIESIRVASLVHDIGKIGIPDAILTKPARLTDEEFRYIREHPAIGAGILQDISAFSNEARMVMHHHENWDGSGYPHGLAGEEIPLAARIINIADSIDAMLMERSYKPSYSVEKMLSELHRCRGRQFDPALVPAVVEWCRKHPDRLVQPKRAAARA